MANYRKAHPTTPGATTRRPLPGHHPAGAAVHCGAAHAAGAARNKRRICIESDRWTSEVMYGHARNLVVVTLVFCVLSACAGGVSGASPDTYLARAGSVLKQDHGKSGLEKAVAIVSKGLADNAGNPRLLAARANYYVALHDYSSALNDLHAIADKEKISSEQFLGMCMLGERVHGMSSRSVACYKKALQRYEKAYEQKHEVGLNYVLAAYMAESPRAGKLLERADASNKAGGDYLHDMFNHGFDRKSYIRAIFP